MKTKFNDYYNDELSYLRDNGKAFAQKYPKIAARLGLGSGNVQDPLVERLLEGFAFLSANVQQSIAASADKMPKSLLSILYPHYLSSIPSLSVISLTPNDQLTQQQSVAKGSLFQCEVQAGQRCYFTSTQAVNLLPLRSTVKYTRLVPSFIKADANTKACCAIQVRPISPSVQCHQLNHQSLEYYIDLPRDQAFAVYEMIMCQVKNLRLVSASDPSISVTLDAACIKSLGFSDDAGLLPYPSNSFIGYRLLTEFFAFPEKFMFFQFDALPIDHKAFSSGFDLYLLLDEHQEQIEKSLQNDSLKLGCTPIVNLFEQQGVPINLTHTQASYQILADSNAKLDEIEVYRVLSFNAMSHGNETEWTAVPCFGATYHHRQSKQLIYWVVEQKPVTELGVHHVNGTESFAMFSSDADGYMSSSITLSPKLLCSNRELPHQIVVGGGKPEMTCLSDEHSVINEVQCLLQFTSVKHRSYDEDLFTNLIDHIVLNQSSFMQSDHKIDLLKQHLSLYNYNIQSNYEFIEQALVDLEIRPKVMRHPSDLRCGVCQGVEIILSVNGEYIPDNSLYVFGAVAHQFFSRLAQMNSFVEFVVINTLNQKVFRWQPLLGQQAVI